MRIPEQIAEKEDGAEASFLPRNESQNLQVFFSVLQSYIRDFKYAMMCAGSSLRFDFIISIVQTRLFPQS
jgi:hypothetical protein